jgi:hypothetical protein
MIATAIWFSLQATSLQFATQVP